MQQWIVFHTCLTWANHGVCTEPLTTASSPRDSGHTPPVVTAADTNNSVYVLPTLTARDTNNSVDILPIVTASGTSDTVHMSFTVQPSGVGLGVLINMSEESKTAFEVQITHKLAGGLLTPWVLKRTTS